MQPTSSLSLEKSRSSSMNALLRLGYSANCLSIDRICLDGSPRSLASCNRYFTLRESSLKFIPILLDYRALMFRQASLNLRHSRYTAISQLHLQTPHVNWMT